MRKYQARFFGGVAIGLVAGIVLGGAGAAWGNFGKKGWERFGQWFQEGYVAGFNDCVRLSKALDPQGYVSTNYIVPPKAKPHMWRLKINEIYAKKENADRPMSQVMIIAGKELAKATGHVEIQGQDPRLENLRKMMGARHKAIRDAHEATKAAEQPATPDAKSETPDATSAAPEGKTAASAGGPAAPAPATIESVPKPEPKPGPALPSKPLPADPAPATKPAEAR